MKVEARVLTRKETFFRTWVTYSQYPPNGPPFVRDVVAQYHDVETTRRARLNKKSLARGIFG